MSAKTIAKGIVSVGTWSATKLIVAGLAVPIYARLLGIEAYGQYAYYVAVLLISSHPANCGMRQMLTKYISERPNDQAWHRRLAGFARSVSTISALVVGAIVLLVQLASATMELRTVAAATILVALIWAEQLHQHAGGILFGLHREAEASLPASLGVVLAGVAGVAFAAMGFGVLGVLSGMLVAGLFVAAVTLRRARHALAGGSEADGGAPLPRRELLQFGLSSMAYAGVAMLLYSIDVVLVRHFAGNEQTGLYAAAVQWSEFVWFVPIAIEGVMLQSTAKLWAEARVDEITRLVRRLMRYVAVTTAYLLIVVFLFSHQIVTVYFGAHFCDAAVPLQLLIPGAFAFALARVIRPVIAAHGWVTTLLKVVSVATGINVALNVVFVPRWGAVGAAVATSVSFVCVALVYVRILRAEGVHPFQGFAAGRFGLLCVGTAAALLPIAEWIDDPFVALTAGGAASLVVYWGGVFWLGLIRVRELEQIVVSLPGPLRAMGMRLMDRLQPMLVRLDAIALN